MSLLSTVSTSASLTKTFRPNEAVSRQSKTLSAVNSLAASVQFVQDQVGGLIKAISDKYSRSQNRSRGSKIHPISVKDYTPINHLSSRSEQPRLKREVNASNIEDKFNITSTSSLLSNQSIESTAFPSTISSVNDVKPTPYPVLASSTIHRVTTKSESTLTSAFPDTSPTSILPFPDWPQALQQWGVLWHVHTWVFALLFVAIAVSSAIMVFRFRARAGRFRVVSNTVLLVGVAAAMRVALLMLDNFRRHDNQGNSAVVALAIGLLTQGAYPFMCASYGLTQVSLQRLTNVATGPAGESKLRSLSWLLGCGLGYIFLVVLVETLVTYKPSLKLLLLLDSGAFIAWALYLCITFICSGFRLTEYALETKRARKELSAFSNHRRAIAEGSKQTNSTSARSGDESTLFTPGDGDTCDHIRNNNNNNNENDAIGVLDVSANVIPESGLVTIERPSSLNFDPCNYQAEPESGEIVVMHGSPLSPSILSTIQTPLPGQGQRSMSRIFQPRLSRPQLRMTDDERMMVAIATEQEDDSTSSTDVDDSALLSPSTPPFGNLGTGPASVFSSTLPTRKTKSQTKKRKKLKKSKASSVVKNMTTSAQVEDVSSCPSSPEREPSVTAMLNCDNSVTKQPNALPYYTGTKGYKLIAQNGQDVDTRDSIVLQDDPGQSVSQMLQKSGEENVSYDKCIMQTPVSTAWAIAGESPSACGGEGKDKNVQVKRNKADQIPTGSSSVKAESGAFLEPAKDSMGKEDFRDCISNVQNSIPSISCNKNNAITSIVSANDDDYNNEDFATSFTEKNPKHNENKTEHIIYGEDEGYREVSQRFIVDEITQVETEDYHDKKHTRDAHQFLSLSSSLRDNGYLADTENTTAGHPVSKSRFMSSDGLSKPPFCLQKNRAKKSKFSSFIFKADSGDEDEGSSDSWIDGDDQTPSSAVIQMISTPDNYIAGASVNDGDIDGIHQERPSTMYLPVTSSSRHRSLTPLGLFRIRQGSLVQKVVTLTYALTFLYLFACLLQLYTAFGVYGVLSSSRVPAPWPWLLFHSIYR
ncbi:proline-rich transmembrane protein 4 [Plakobranchus ocellatus]|uniref:Proline-rich transmembrane protein 4 n=1 Tax=Plakobranchus ocellatus TaxID=259542 RepID=A0AAV4AJI5_9GAST|nr:proline-rich transmembrane protein 4 [Plakobranchus ocellatus]